MYSKSLLQLLLIVRDVYTPILSRYLYTDHRKPFVARALFVGQTHGGEKRGGESRYPYMAIEPDDRHIGNNLCDDVCSDKSFSCSNLSMV